LVNIFNNILTLVHFVCNDVSADSSVEECWANQRQCV